MSHVALARHAVTMLAVVALVSISGVTGLAQERVAGNWTLTVDSPQGDMTVGLAVAVNGEAVKGSVSSEMGDTTFTGSVKGADLAFSFDMTGPNGPLNVKAKATVSGDEIKGEMDYGMGVAPFKGKRAEP